VNRYAAVLLLILFLAVLVACDSADGDPARHERVEKPVPVTATKE